MEETVRAGVIQMLVAVLGEDAGATALDNDSLTDDLGADSIDLVELAMAIEQHFSLAETEDDVQASIKTVGDVIAHVTQRLAGKIDLEAAPTHSRSANGYRLDLFLGTGKYDILDVVNEASGAKERYDWFVKDSPKTPEEIDAYLTAALAGALDWKGYASRTHDAGINAVKALRMKNWTSAPTHCPYCGSRGVREIGAWSATSKEDKDNTAELMEYQCHSHLCQGRSFFV